MPSLPARISAPAFAIALAALAFTACSEDAPPASSSSGSAPSDGGATTGKDGATAEPDAAGERDSAVPEDSGTKDDGGTCPGPIVTTPGETCIGFGPKGDSCDPACGQPYGYVCFEGAPPGFTGCRKVNDTAFGQTYCCPKNDCVAQPDQDAMCNGTAGKPHRYQCPPDGAGGNVAPPAGCTEKGSGGSEVEKFYCCP